MLCQVIANLIMKATDHSRYGHRCLIHLKSFLSLRRKLYRQSRLARAIQYRPHEMNVQQFLSDDSGGVLFFELISTLFPLVQVIYRFHMSCTASVPRE